LQNDPHHTKGKPMSKFDEAVALYQAEVQRLGMTIAPELLRAVTKSLGPSIYRDDAARVSFSDKTELDRVKNNFLIGKLGLADGPELDKALAECAEAIGKSNKNKYRAIVYAWLAIKLNATKRYA
jgi:Protein of unknown function (DUF2853)